MFTILNRLRGTYGWMSKVIGVLLAIVVFLAFNNPYVALMVGIGYVLGESFGWGEWVGNLSVHRMVQIDSLKDEGVTNGIQWLSKKLVPNYLTNYIKYCRVALSIRGLYWWIPTIAPLYFVGVNPYLLIGSILALSICFPIACELGYKNSNYLEFKYKFLEYKGAWELQEGFYGIMQDVVFIIIIWSVL